MVKSPFLASLTSTKVESRAHRDAGYRSIIQRRPMMGAPSTPEVQRTHRDTFDITVRNLTPARRRVMSRGMSEDNVRVGQPAAAVK